MSTQFYIIVLFELISLYIYPSFLSLFLPLFSMFRQYLKEYDPQSHASFLRSQAQANTGTGTSTGTGTGTSTGTASTAQPANVVIAPDQTKTTNKPAESKTAATKTAKPTEWVEWVTEMKELERRKSSQEGQEGKEGQEGQGVVSESPKSPKTGAGSDANKALKSTQGQGQGQPGVIHPQEDPPLFPEELHTQ